METSSVERRSIPFAVERNAQGRTISGYAAVFNRPSRLIPDGMRGGFVETILPTFFDEARTAGWPGVQGAGVLCRYNHSPNFVLGSTRAGTCQLSVDRTGLEYRTDVPQCRDDVLELVARGDINSSSFTFMDGQDDWTYRGGITLRTLIGAGTIVDVAPVSEPAAYPDATVALRSLAASRDASEDDVYALAAQDELRRLFTRNDRPQPRGAAVMSYGGYSQPDSRPTLTADAARLILMATRIPPSTRAEVALQRRQVQEVHRLVGA